MHVVFICMAKDDGWIRNELLQLQAEVTLFFLFISSSLPFFSFVHSRTFWWVPRPGRACARLASTANISVTFDQRDACFENWLSREDCDSCLDFNIDSGHKCWSYLSLLTLGKAEVFTNGWRDVFAVSFHYSNVGKHKKKSSSLTNRR